MDMDMDLDMKLETRHGRGPLLSVKGLNIRRISCTYRNNFIVWFLII